MARIVKYRDFTLCKAALLAGLIGLAALMGEVPHPAGDHAMIQTGQPERVVPVLMPFFKDCDDLPKAVDL